MKFLLTILCVTINLGAATYYFDSVSGLDSNNGLSTNTPKKYHFYMRAYSGSAYSWNGSDRFLFKGGVTWSNTAFQMRIVKGGINSSSNHYYGVDTNWYTGGSWSKPIWNFQSAYVTNSQSQTGNSRSAGVLLDGFTTSTNEIKYVTFDSIDVKNALFHTGSTGHGEACFTQRGWVHHITYKNMLIRDWDLPTPITTGQDGANSGGIMQVDARTDISNTVVTNCIFNQSNVVQKCGFGLKGWFNLYNSEISDVCNAIIGQGDWIGNHVFNIRHATDTNAHENALYLQSRGNVIGNKVHDLVIDSSAIYLSPSFQRPSSAIVLCANNVVWNVGNQHPIVFDSEAGDMDGLKVQVWALNNTLRALNGSADCIRIPTNRSKVGGFIAINNHFITTDTSPISFASNRIGTVPIIMTNLQMTPTTATNQGYVIANYFAPTSSTNSTVGVGTNLSFYGFSTDINGYVRSNAWDIGAYQFHGTNPLPALQYFKFAQESFSGWESNFFIPVEILRLGPTTNSVSVNYITTNGAAIAGLDYLHINSTATFGVGVSNYFVNVPVFDNGLFTGDREFYMSLTNATGGTIITPSRVRVTIVEDEPEPPPVTQYVAFVQSVYTINENGSNFTATVSRIGPNTNSITVDYFTANGTATNGVDYTSASGTLTFTNGQNSRNITVPIIDNLVYNSNRYFYVWLTNALGCEIAEPTNTVVTIINNDPQIQVLSFSQSSVSVGERAGTVSLQVRRTGPTTNVITTSYDTADGTAIAPYDYTRTFGILAFNIGESNKFISVPIIWNRKFKGNLAFTMTLAGATGASNGSPSTVTVTIIESDKKKGNKASGLEGISQLRGKVRLGSTNDN